MISARARDGFDQLLVRAIRSSLTLSPNDDCEIAVLDDTSGIAETKIIMLTISSYVFRLVVFIHFSPNRQTKNYFAKLRKIAPDEMSDQSFYDTIAECGNVCCGILNRELWEFYPHIGMSTPNIMDRNCTTHLGALRHGHIRHFKIRVDDDFEFHAGLCVCDYADIDFAVKPEAIESSIGELELF
jgi:hypothetical protein